MSKKTSYTQFYLHFSKPEEAPLKHPHPLISIGAMAQIIGKKLNYFLLFFVSLK